MSGARSAAHAANKKAVINYNGSGSHIVENKSVQKEQKYSDTYGDPVGGATGEGQKKRRKMKTWIILALLAIGGILAYSYFGGSNAEPQVANEVTVDSTQVEEIETPYQKRLEQEEKRIQEQETKSQPNCSQEVTPEPVNEEPVKEVKYAPNGEPLLEKPEYPKNGNFSQEWLKKKKEYDEQQLRIIEWREKHGTVYIEYKEPSFEEFLAASYRLSRRNRVAYL